MLWPVNPEDHVTEQPLDTPTDDASARSQKGPLACDHLVQRYVALGSTKSKA